MYCMTIPGIHTSRRVAQGRGEVEDEAARVGARPLGQKSASRSKAMRGIRVRTELQDDRRREQG